MAVRTQHTDDVAVLVENQSVRVENDRYKDTRQKKCL